MTWVLVKGGWAQSEKKSHMRINPIRQHQFCHSDYWAGWAEKRAVEHMRGPGALPKLAGRQNIQTDCCLRFDFSHV